MLDRIELQKYWILQLIEEYKKIAVSRKIPLPLPNFEILSSKKKVGHWSKQSRTIGISCNFIETHTWDVVVEVLKHEIAHQYVDEILRKDQALPHGEEFREACERIGVHPEYRTAYGAIPKFKNPAEENSADTRKQIRKIEKLLALAESSNENEASLAMQRANQLITQYNINIIQKNAILEYDYVRVSTGKKRLDIWTKEIGGLISDHFFCQTIITQSYDAHTNSSTKAIDLIGSKENLQIAEHVFYFLHERLLILWKQHQKKTGAKGKEKRSYYLGVLHAFREKMKEEDQKNNSEILNNTPHKTTGALVVAEDVALNDFYTMRYPNVRRSRTKAGRLYSGAYNSGQDEGKRLTIHKSVSNSMGNQGLCLSNKHESL